MKLEDFIKQTVEACRDVKIEEMRIDVKVDDSNKEVIVGENVSLPISATLTISRKKDEPS